LLYYVDGQLMVGLYGRCLWRRCKDAKKNL